MKVYRVTVVCLIGATVFSVVTDIYLYSIILAISLTPMLVLHGKKDLAEVHKNKLVFEGIKVLHHPLLIYFFLLLTHQIWSF